MTFLDFSLDATRSAAKRSASGYASVRSVSHPATVSYLNPEQPLRQGFVQQLQQPTVVQAPPADPNPAMDPVQTAPQPISQDVSTPRPITTQVGNLPTTLQTASGPLSFDYTADPFLQQALAQRDAALKASRGNVIHGYEDLLTGFGSQDLAQKTLSQLLSSPEYQDASGGQDLAPYLAAISDNPDTSFSTLAQIKRALNEAQRSNAYDYNGANLFYSGARGRALKNLDYGNQLQINTATSALQQALSGISGKENDYEQGWASQIAQAEQDAYNRALQLALLNASTGAPTATPTPDPNSPAGGPLAPPTALPPYDPTTDQQAIENANPNQPGLVIPSPGSPNGVVRVFPGDFKGAAKKTTKAKTQADFYAALNAQLVRR